MKMHPPDDDSVMDAVLEATFRTEAPERLFGDWRQPVTCTMSPTPIGTPCFVCCVPIADGDTGCLLERRDTAILEPFHLDCFALLLYGHEVRVCPCTGFAGCLSDEGIVDVPAAAKLVAQRKRDSLKRERGQWTWPLPQRRKVPPS